MILKGESDNSNPLASAVAESKTENYGDNLTEEKIITITAQLTESLLTKVRELHQGFGATELGKWKF